MKCKIELGRRCSFVRTLAIALAGLAAAAALSAQEPLKKIPPDPKVTAPKSFFGYDIGDDFKLTPWSARDLPGEGPRKGITDYDRELERTSNRVRVFPNGTTEMGRTMMLTVITAPENWAKIDQLKAINKKLADPRQVASDDEARSLARQGKAVYWVDAGIHATERTGAETLIQLSYELASGRDEWTMNLLKDVIVVIEGTINPDGLDIVTDWYYTYKDTPFVGSSPPYYNKYNGHDDNRDFIRLSLKESQNSARARFEWNPIMYTDLHQQQDLLYLGMSSDPSNFAENPIANAELGSMSFYVISQMIAQGYKGVFTYDYADMWNPSYNHMYTVMHNANGSWWELMGATYATPRTINSGAHARRRTWFNPQPYTVPLQWRLIDALNIQKDAVKNSLTWTMRNKEDLLYNFYLKGRTNMAKAAAEPPYAFVIPANGGDNVDVTDLINTLVTAQRIEVDRAAAPFTVAGQSVAGQSFAAGDYVVRMNQPYGLYAKLLLTRQDFPVEALDPRNRTASYDHLAWTMGLMSDVKVVALDSQLPADIGLTRVAGNVPYEGTLTGSITTDYAVDHQANNGWAAALPRLWQSPGMSVSQVDTPFGAAGRSFPAGTFIVHTRGTQADHLVLKALVQETGLTAVAISGPMPSAALRQPKVGLFKPNSGTMPEGWTRMRLDRAGFPYVSMSPVDLSGGDLAGYQVIIIPSLQVNSMINGSAGGNTPPEFRAGIGAKGVAALKGFVEAGGTLILMGQAVTLPISEKWDIGVSQPAVQRPVCRGSILRIQVDPATRVGYGYDPEEACWFLDGSTPLLAKTPGSKAQVVASYAEKGDLLLSGYISGGDVLRGLAAVVEAPLGKGHVVLIAPDVLYRAQSTGTFMFFWNAIIAGARQ